MPIRVAADRVVALYQFSSIFNPAIGAFEIFLTSIVVTTSFGPAWYPAS